MGTAVMAPRYTALEAPRLQLNFKPLTYGNLPVINNLLHESPSRTCDYSIGGIYMWIRRFNYHGCIAADTLFINGLSELDRCTPAFMLPVGRLPLVQSLAMIEDYCRRQEVPALLSAVPADRLESVLALRPGAQAELLADWADYLYDIHDFATLQGKRFNKKRNHVNRFRAENPDYVFEGLTRELVPECLLFMEGLRLGQGDDPLMGLDEAALYEATQTSIVLAHLDEYPFEGAVLRGQSGEIVAFTLGEVQGDTLFCHIEKMNHSTPGAGEMVAHLFAQAMAARHPGLKYLNREEDCGDAGLRRAKESWNPLCTLKKYNVLL